MNSFGFYPLLLHFKSIFWATTKFLFVFEKLRRYVGMRSHRLWRLLKYRQYPITQAITFLPLLFFYDHWGGSWLIPAKKKTVSECLEVFFGCTLIHVYSKICCTTGYDFFCVVCNALTMNGQKTECVPNGPVPSVLIFHLFVCNRWTDIYFEYVITYHVIPSLPRNTTVRTYPRDLIWVLWNQAFVEQWSV